MSGSPAPVPAPAPAQGFPSLTEIVEVATLQAGLNTTVVILGTTMLGAAAGIVGVFALLRRRSLVADALGHATLPGIAIAFLVSISLGGSGRSLPVLLAGATASGLLGVATIQGLVRHTRLRDDAAIAVVLSVFFGAGVVLLSWIQANAPSSSAGLGHFLFGRTASMLPRDAWLMAGLAAVVAIATGLLRREFLLLSFDEDHARAGGWPTGTLDAAILTLIALVTVAGLQAVGIVLVVAMLVIPPVTARLWTDRFLLLVALAGGIGGASAWIGAVVSALLPRQPAGAVIVLAAGGVFALSLIASPRRGAVARAWRRWRLRIRIEGDHLLESAFVHEVPVGASIARELDRTVRERRWSGWFRATVLASLRREERLQGGELRLTAAGLDRGRTVDRNHRLWEAYLVTHADIAPSHVDWSVDQVEHALDPALVARLEAVLANDARDPHDARPDDAETSA